MEKSLKNDRYMYCNSTMRFPCFSFASSGGERSRGGPRERAHASPCGGGSGGEGGGTIVGVSLAHLLRVILVVAMIVSARGARYVESKQLKLGFYKKTCPSAEKIVRYTMATHFKRNANIAANILRMQFHDCAFTGCDASILLTGPRSEQNAPANVGLKGFDVIDDIKSKLDASCWGVVSCADILTMAARDAVFLTGGPFFSVPLGRYDSSFSGGLNVNLPAPSISVPASNAFFQGLGLSTVDMVALLGAHTIGQAQCTSFNYRLFNYQNTGAPDPTIDRPYLAVLQSACPQKLKTNGSIALDLKSQYDFDNHFYGEMIKQHGVLGIDQEIHVHPLTTRLVDQMARNATFFKQSFMEAMIKMGQISVLSSKSGWVRRKCYY